MGYIGPNLDWDVNYQYAWTTSERGVSGDGVRGFAWPARTPDEALRELWRELLDSQRREDSKWTNPEGRREAARLALHEFLEESAD